MPKTMKLPARLLTEDAFSVPFVLPPTGRDVVERPDQAARAITVLEPRGETLDALLGVNHTRVSDAGLLDLLEASERHLAAIQARQQVLLAEVARRDPTASGSCATRRRWRSRPRRSPPACGSRARCS